MSMALARNVFSLSPGGI